MTNVIKIRKIRENNINAGTWKIKVPNCQALCLPDKYPVTNIIYNWNKSVNK